jgi:hypothetical protein
MGIFRYVRWRLSPQGRMIYKRFEERQRVTARPPVAQSRAVPPHLRQAHDRFRQTRPRG